MKKYTAVSVAAAAVMALSCAAYSGQNDMLLEKLVEKQVITDAEARQLSIESLEQERADVMSGKSQTLPLWLQNISMKGDFRLRHQIDWDSSKTFPRIRERIRLRTGFNTRVSESLKVGFGLATGSEKFTDTTLTVSTRTGTGSLTGTSIIDAEPTSTNHTFGNGFSKPVLLVDYAFLEYTPFSWVKVTGGKMNNPIWYATDLLWDGDINPDGFAVSLKKETIPEKLSFFFNGAWFVFNEKNSSANNPDVYIGQLGPQWSATEKIKVKAAVAYHVYSVNGKDTGFYGTPAFDYTAMNPSLNVTLAEIAGPYSLDIFGDTASNSDSKPTSDKAASAYGIKFGDTRITKFGQWQLSYLQRRIEANAWLSKLGDSDAYGGATNSSGYEAILTMGLTNNATFGIDYYAMDKISGATKTTAKSLIQCDVVYKF